MEHSKEQFENILNNLLESPLEDARAAVAAQGYGLDVLISDKSEKVRAVVAAKGYGLDKLINDPSPLVRLNVATQGYGWDILVQDPEPFVRHYLAEQGYRPDLLRNDPNYVVRDTVWCLEHPDEKRNLSFEERKFQIGAEFENTWLWAQEKAAMHKNGGIEHLLADATARSKETVGKGKSNIDFDKEL